MRSMMVDDADIVGAERSKYEWGLGLTESYIADMKDLPSAGPERESAEWVCWYEKIENDTCTEYRPHCKCSECGTEYDSHTVKFINFCSCCGAKMKLSNKEENNAIQ